MREWCGKNQVTLPQVKLYEFTSFIQIRFGNHQTIGELTELGPWQEHPKYLNYKV